MLLVTVSVFFIFCDFLARFYDMKNTRDTYYVTVIVDKQLDKIIGSGTILREKKFIHECGSVNQHKIKFVFAFDLLICFSFSEGNYRGHHCE